MQMAGAAWVTAERHFDSLPWPVGRGLTFCVPLSTSFFRALVLVLWSDQHILQGGKRKAGGGGQVAMASKHSVPGAVRLQWLPHPPQLDPHSRTLPAKVSLWGH